MSKKFIISEEEKKEIRDQYNINEDWWSDTLEVLKGLGLDFSKYLSNSDTSKLLNLDSSDFSAEEKQEFENKIEDVKKDTTKKIDDSELKDFNFHEIPDNNGNFRSAQLTSDLLPSVIKKYNIKRVIRFNGESSDAKHGSHQGPSISEEKKICEENDCQFFKLSSTRDQEKVNSLLSQGNVLIHCAHGADRTGGNVGGYLKSIGWGDTKKIWDYTTQYNGWNRMVKNNPSTFVNGGYLKQAQKFGVKDLQHAKSLSK